MLKKTVEKLIAVAFWVAVWFVFAALFKNPLLIPTPLQVISKLGELCLTAAFWQTVLFSLVRIVCGIAISLLSGVLLGVLSARFYALKLLISPLMSLAKSTPVASFILLALLWFSRNTLPVFICVLIVTPVVCEGVMSGIASVDKKLIEVAKVFSFTRVKKIKRLYIPSVYPYFMASCRSSFGLAWKAGIAAEVLSVPALSIGKMIYDSKLYLETVDLFAWTLVVVILSVFIEKAFGYLFRKHIKDWQVKGNA